MYACAPKMLRSANQNTKIKCQFYEIFLLYVAAIIVLCVLMEKRAIISVPGMT